MTLEKPPMFRPHTGVRRARDHTRNNGMMHHTTLATMSEFMNWHRAHRLDDLQISKHGPCEVSHANDNPATF